MTPWVDSCTLTQPKGVKGRLGVALAPGFFALKPGYTVFCVPPLLDQAREHVIEAAGCDAKGQWWVELSGVTTRDAASALCGCHCLMRRVDLEPRDEAFGDEPVPIDWTGWTIVDEASDFRGVVTSVQLRPIQPLLYVRDAEGGETMVPLADELIVRCEPDTQTLRLALPPGLISLGIS